MKSVGFTGRVVTLHAPAQGIADIKLSDPDLRLWLESEIQGWKTVDFPRTVKIEGMAAAVEHRLADNYIEHLQDVLASVSTDLAKVTDYFRRAQSLEVLLFHSPLGRAVRSLDDEQELYLTYELSPLFTKYAKGGAQSLNVRALIAVNPAVLAAVDLQDAQAFKYLLSDTLKDARKLCAELREGQRVVGRDAQKLKAEFSKAVEDHQTSYNTWFAAQQAELEATRDIYHKHVQTEAAATYWQTKARNATRIAWAAFTAFIVMVGGALYVGYLHFEAIKTYVQDLASSSSTISLTPIVVVTVPVLAYAWILRHISRVFIQNLTIADDAAYRRLMTMTFLGLSHDPKSGVTQAERAIILNALFRPAPPNTTEDGPPTGLLDIITKKP